MDDEAPVLLAQPASEARDEPSFRGKSALLWLVLLVQLAIPASYYLWRIDREDERFAWRMFSSLRFRSCRVQVTEQVDGQERPLPLAPVLHASWIGTLRRGRGRVIERFLKGRCAQAGVDAATLVRTCREVDEHALPVQRFVYVCESGRLTQSPAGELL
jgi:hypothetical protein